MHKGSVPSDVMHNTLRALDLVKAEQGFTDKQLSIAMGLAETVVNRWRHGASMSSASARKVAAYLRRHANKSA